MPPPDFSWPLTFGWLSQTLFPLPGCRMRSSDTLSSMPNLLEKPGLASRVPRPFGQRHSPVQGAGRRWALGQLAPVGAGAGCHAAPWGSSEATLVASRLSSHSQHAGLGRRQRGPRWRTARRSDKAACKGLRSEAEQDDVWGPWSQGEEDSAWREQTRIPVTGCTQHFARAQGGRAETSRPLFVYCCRKSFVSCFCCFVFSLAVCFLREKEVCNYFIQSSHYVSEKEEIL